MGGGEEGILPPLSSFSPAAPLVPSFFSCGTSVDESGGKRRRRL